MIPVSFYRFIRANPVGIWGGRLPNGSWTGMLGSLERNEADVIVAGVGVVLERRRYVVDYPLISADATPSIME